MFALLLNRPKSAKKYSQAVGHAVKAYYGVRSKTANDPGG